MILEFDVSEEWSLIELSGKEVSCDRPKKFWVKTLFFFFFLGSKQANQVFLSLLLSSLLSRICQSSSSLWSLKTCTDEPLDPQPGFPHIIWEALNSSGGLFPKQNIILNSISILSLTLMLRDPMKSHPQHLLLVIFFCLPIPTPHISHPRQSY